jgi:hypothetical protein
MVEFYVKTHDPKSHIEACSLINYFNCEIIKDKVCEKDEPFYGVFYVRHQRMHLRYLVNSQSE